MGRLLFIGAHPDDETFFAAGTFARYAAEGHSIAVVCATRGQKGKTGGLCSPEDLPTRREQELRSAMRTLGVADVTMLGYQDRELATAPVEELRRHLVGKIRAFRPDIVMTFDPLGGNAHPDHVAISAFTSDAIAIARDRRWYPDLGNGHEIGRLLWTPPVFIYKLPPERDIYRQPGFDFVIDVSEWRQQKEDAFRSHATQFPGLRRLFFDDENGQRTFHLEAFRLAHGKKIRIRPAENLWAGLHLAGTLPDQAQHQSNRNKRDG